MKLFIFLTLAILSGGAAAAGWELIGEDSEQGTKTYIDKDTVVNLGPLRRMWSLTDYENPRVVGGIEHLSKKELDEYDCEHEQSRRIYAFWYSGRQGAGELVYSNVDPSTELAIIPGSAAEIAWEAACGKEM